MPSSSARRRRIRRGLVLGEGDGSAESLYYQEAIFRHVAGFGGRVHADMVIVGGAKLVATLFTVSQVDHYGRRALFAEPLMLVALVALSYAFLARPLAGGDGRGSSRARCRGEPGSCRGAPPKKQRYW